VLDFDFVQFINYLLGSLVVLIELMSQLVAVTAQSEHLRVKRWDVWLNVIKQVRLQQVGSVHFHVNLLEEVLNT
jgi:hypothetical protein